MDEINLLAAACANRNNEPARGLMNAFGVVTAQEILEQIKAAPAELHQELGRQLREALDTQRRVPFRR